jgi:hypothetical protein
MYVCMCTYVSAYVLKTYVFMYYELVYLSTLYVCMYLSLRVCVGDFNLDI